MPEEEEIEEANGRIRRKAVFSTNDDQMDTGNSGSEDDDDNDDEFDEEHKEQTPKKKSKINGKVAKNTPLLYLNLFISNLNFKINNIPGFGI